MTPKSKMVYLTLENRFSVILWLMAIWLMLMWFCPLLIQQFVGIIAYNRHNYFINMHHVQSYMDTADGLFVFLSLVSAVMILITLILSGLYLYGKYMYKDEAVRKSVNNKGGVTQSTWFRITIVSLFLVLMILMSVAAILQVGCVDSNTIREKAIELKYPPHSADDVRNMKRYAKYAFDMAMNGESTDATYGTYYGTGFFLKPGLPTMTKDASVINNIENGTLATMASSNTIRLRSLNGNNMPVESSIGAAVAATLATNPTLYYVENDALGRTVLSVPNYTRIALMTDPTQSVAYNLARDLLVSSDVSTDAVSFVKYVLEQEGVVIPTLTQMAELMGTASFKTGLAYGYLTVVQAKLVKAYNIAGSVNTLNLDSIIASTEMCDSMVAYSSGLFFIVFLMVFIFTLVMFFYRKVFRAHMYNGDYEMISNLRDEEQFNDDEFNLESFSDITPLSAR